AAEAQGRVQTARLYAMTDDPGVKEMLKFNLARDTVHQNLWLAAIEELKEDGLEGAIAPNALFDEENQEHADTIWGLSAGSTAAQGGWMRRTAPDGQRRLRYLEDPNRWADRLPSRRPATRCTGRSRVLPAKARRKAPSVPRGRGKASPTKSKTPSTRRCPAAEPQDSAAAPPELLRSAAARSAVRTVRGAVPGHLWGCATADRITRRRGTSMRALTWQGPRDVRVETVPDPTIEEPTDAIIRITSSGLCGSDLHLYEVMAPF